MSFAKSLFILFSISVSLIGSAQATVANQGLCQIVDSVGNHIGYLDPRMYEQGMDIINESGAKKTIIARRYHTSLCEIDMSSDVRTCNIESFDPRVGGFFNIQIGNFTSPGSGSFYKVDNKWLRFKYGETSVVKFPKNDAHQEFSVICSL